MKKILVYLVRAHPLKSTTPVGDAISNNQFNSHMKSGLTKTKYSPEKNYNNTCWKIGK